jgi:hypothetical protein
LTYDETTIIAGALELTSKTASQAMTPIEDVFALDVNSKLDLHETGWQWFTTNNHLFHSKCDDADDNGKRS